MGTSKEFKDYVLESLKLLDGITCRPMMGEFLLYYNGLLFGGIYDYRLLVKVTATNEKFGLEKVEPYKGAKLMYLVNTDNPEDVKEIVLSTCEGLKSDKKK